MPKSLSPQEALHKAAAYCSSGEQCCYDISEKLKKWGIEDSEASKIIEYLITFILRLHRYMLEMIFRAHTRDDATYRIGLRPVAILGSNRIGSRGRKIKSGATSRLDSSAGSQGEYRG